MGPALSSRAEVSSALQRWEALQGTELFGQYVGPTHSHTHDAGSACLRKRALKPQ